MARPRVADAERRSTQLGVRFRKRDLAAVRRAASRAALPPVEFVRQAAIAAAGAAPALTATDVEIARGDLTRQITRVGVNLNAAARLASKPPPLEPVTSPPRYDPPAATIDLRRAVDATRDALERVLDVIDR